tara:strand:+ start:1566 stop:1727 length:162 start_codon:yes stop_codon:yes gene_type:complete
MGGKSRKSGKVSKKLIDKLKALKSRKNIKTVSLTKKAKPESVKNEKTKTDGFF